MCLSDLASIVEYDPTNLRALVDLDGRQVFVSTIALGLDPPALERGDWLVVHTGLALEKIADEDARRIQSARDELANGPREDPQCN